MLKNIKIAPKLILCFMIVVILASISGVVGTVLLQSTDGNYSKALVNNGFSQGEIGSFNTYLNKGGAVVRDIIMLTTQEEITAAQLEMDNIRVKTDEALAELRPKCTSDEEKALIAVIDEKLPEYRKIQEQVIAMGLENKNTEALELFRSQARPILNEVMVVAESLAELNTDMGLKVSKNLSDQSRMTMLVIIIIIALSALISIIFAIAIAKSIAKPIIRVQKAAAQLAQGDLKIHIESVSNDEIGLMTKSFADASEMMRRYIADITRGLSEIAKGNFTVIANEAFIGDFKEIEQAILTIVSSLSNTLGQINQAAEQVSSGSDQVSAGAQALSQGATEQASSVEELAATITEISEQVKGTAVNAEDANAQARTAGEEVTVCNQQMQDMIIAMAEISDKSGQIGKIIKTIEDIALQTNILALNAAVEAARAGVSGKGFAVVADEVRSLASKSATAAKDTTALIESTIKAVGNGTRIVDETAKTLISVVECTRNVTQTVDRISEAAGEQANSIVQVSTGIDQISSVVQTNSATAQESAAASEELSSQAQVLKELVGRFQLKGSTHSIYLENERIPAPGISEFSKPKIELLSDKY